MGVNKTIDMSPQARKIVKELIQRHLSRVTVWAYGSRVKWTARPDSDLDLMVFAGKEQQEDIANLREAFDESDLPFRVDIFIWDEVPERFQGEIREGYVVMQEKKEERHRSYAGPSLVGLSSEWEIQTLESVCNNIFDCPHSTPKLSDDGPFMVRTQDVRNGYFDSSEAVHVSWETYRERTTRAVPIEGDILLSREGTYFGDAAEVPPETPLCLGQRMVLLRPNQLIADSTFLRLWINSRSFQNYLTAFRDGTVAERINVSTIRKLPVPVPPKRIQDYIVTQILPLEEKQHLNRKMNQALEAMAQTIFKSWFVDFDPVKAKQAAKALGGNPERAARAALSGKLSVPKNPADLSAEALAEAEAELTQLGEEERKQLEQTAALFPDGFVESELGLIPKGWEAAPLKTYIEITKGRSYKSTELAESTTALVTLKSFQRGGGYREDGLKAFTGQYKPEQKVEPGELIVAFTDVTQAADVIGKPALVRSDPDYDTFVASLDVGIVRPTSHLSLSYLYFTLVAPRFQSHAYGHCSGTTVLHLSKTALPSYQTIIPKSQLMKQFDLISQPALDMMEELAKESRTLAAVRDSLLPKLLSGELLVPEAD